FAMALVAEESRLRLVLRRWSALGVPLPMWLFPRSDSYESTADGRVPFPLDINHPLSGLIVRHRGWLAAPPRQALPKIGCLTLSPGLIPRSRALPPLISSTARTGYSLGIVSVECGLALAWMWRMVPSLAMNTMSSGMRVFFIQKPTGASR